MKAVIVIPARLKSTRLPEKLLLDRTGMTLIEHTCRAAGQSRLADDVIVATDSEQIRDAVIQFGGQVQMTSVSHVSGTDRVAEVAARIDAELIVNLQGDEPEIDGAALDRLIELLNSDRDIPMATLATPIRTREQLLDLACVKVVFSGSGSDSGRALYFSRNPIPGCRDAHLAENCFSDRPESAAPVYFQHIGVYAYRREFLRTVASLPPTRLETLESLEQLRILENGHAIEVAVVEHPAGGIDTPEDYERFVNRFCGR